MKLKLGRTAHLDAVQANYLAVLNTARGRLLGRSMDDYYHNTVDRVNQQFDSLLQEDLQVWVRAWS